MNRPLRIAVADDEPDVRDFFRAVLPTLGHEVVCAAEDGRRLVEQCRAAHPDLIIADVRMPGLDGVAAVEQICAETPVPVVLVTAHADPDAVERAAGHALVYLIKPIKLQDVGPAVTLAVRRFEQMQALRQEASDLRQALEDRKTVERAKGAVIRRLGVDEAEAFRRMKRLASNHNRKLVDVARSVLTAEEVFAALEDPRPPGPHRPAGPGRVAAIPEG